MPTRSSGRSGTRPADLKGYEPLWAELAELVSARSRRKSFVSSKPDAFRHPTPQSFTVSHS